MTPISPAEVRLDSLRFRLEVIERLTQMLQELLGEKYLDRNSMDDVQRRLSRYQESLGNLVYFLRSVHGKASV